MNRSYWRRNGDAPTFAPQQMESVHTDVVVIGGGITGVTAAALLAMEGVETTLIEGRQIGAGVTGNTSAHLTQLFDTGFAKLRKTFDRQGAKLTWKAGGEAIDLIESLVDEHDIDCDFARVPGYLYAESTEHLQSFREERSTLAVLGISVREVRHELLPFSIADAMSIPDQARFHPLRYLTGLASKASELDSLTIHEKTRGLEIDDAGNGRVTVKTEAGQINARHAIVATHMPITTRFSLVQSEAVPYRSYCILARVGNSIPDALYWDLHDPYFYTRLVNIDGQDLLLVGGADHKTGHVRETEERYRVLEEYVRSRYDVQEVVERWSAQFYEPADGLPYIGSGPVSDHVHFATGYSGNGLTMGTIAARIMTDAVLERENESAELFRPTRLKPVELGKHLLKEGPHILEHLIADRFKAEIDSLDELPKGEGRLIRIDGKQTAAYRDEEGEVHLLDASCTHAGCILRWNNSEKSWDCGCHGSRFGATGELLEGPAVEGQRAKVKDQS